MNNQEPIYVVSAYDDYSDAYAVKFDSRAKAEIFLHTEQYDFRVREMMTEDQFLAKWSKPADAFLDEAAANDKGYTWDDYNDCWIGIAVDNDYDYRTWFKSYELCKHWRKSDKLEDKIKLANNGDEADIDDLMKDPRWSQCKEIKKAAIVLYGDDKYLDKLVHDHDPIVREAVASIGRKQDLDLLVYDENAWVRDAVAKYGRDKDLDVLVRDPDWVVRKAVAEHGRKKDLAILIKDVNNVVRKIAIAKQG